MGELLCRSVKSGFILNRRTLEINLLYHCDNRLMYSSQFDGVEVG